MISVDEKVLKSLNYINLCEKDLKILKSYQNDIKKMSKDIIQNLYKNNILKFEETKSIFLNKTSIEKMNPIQEKYLLSLCSGVIDEHYVQSRYKIGAVHSKIGLKPTWYLSTYAAYFEYILEHIKDIGFIISLNKIFTFDTALVLESYEKEESKQILELDHDIHEFKDRIDSINKINAQINKELDHLNLIGLNAYIEASRKNGANSENAFKIVTKEIRNVAYQIQDKNKEYIIHIEEVNKIFNMLEKSLADYINSKY